MPFLEKCVKDGVLKKNGSVLSNPDLKESLLDIAIAMLDVSNPEAIVSLKCDIKRRMDDVESFIRE